MVNGLILAPGLDEFMAEFTVKEVNAEHVAFMATEATVELIHHVVEKLGIKSYKTFFVKNIISTSEAIEEFINAFQWLKANNCTKITVDATNCITVMEMATYVAASLMDLFEKGESEHEVKLIYIHSDFEIKEDGVAGEIRGTEKIIELEKPLDSLGIILAHDAIHAFNNNRYAQAEENFRVLGDNSTSEKALFYRGLKNLAKAYNEWDRMNFEESLTNLKKAEDQLNRVWYTRNKTAFSHLKENIKVLEELTQHNETAIIIDLYMNALRRQKSQRYDDALARLYACIERIVQHQLKKHGIITKNPNYENLPSQVKERFGKETGLPKELELKKGLLLLSMLDNPIGKEVLGLRYKAIVGIIGLRNMSILAHGIKPIGEKNFLDFKEKLSDKLYNTFLLHYKIGAGFIDGHKHIKLSNVRDLMYKERL